MEKTDGVASAPDARHELLREASDLIQDLSSGLVSDHALKIANHHRVRMRAKGRAQKIITGFDIGDPVTHRLANGIFERAVAAVDGHRFRAKDIHPMNVRKLSLHVHAA